MTKRETVPDIQARVEAARQTSLAAATKVHELEARLAEREAEHHSALSAHASFTAARLDAQKRFDDDPSCRPDYLDARDNEQDALADVERAERRLASAGTELADARLDDRRMRQAWLDLATSEEVTKSTVEPTAQEVEALFLLLGNYVEAYEKKREAFLALSREMNAFDEPTPPGAPSPSYTREQRFPKLASHFENRYHRSNRRLDNVIRKCLLAWLAT